MSHFAEFPKMLYKQGHPHVTVHSQKEEEEHASKGYTATPATPVVDRGDKVNYSKQHEPSEDEVKQEIAEAKKPVVVLDATEKTGASPKHGLNETKGVVK